jgi:hypothetical protein
MRELQHGSESGVSITQDRPPNELAIVVGRVQISSFSLLHATLEPIAGPFLGIDVTFKFNTEAATIAI